LIGNPKKEHRRHTRITTPGILGRKAQPQKLTSVTVISKQLLLGVHEADAGSCCILVACLLGELVVVDLRALELASITSLEVTGRNVRTSGGVFRLWNAAAIRSMSR